MKKAAVSGDCNIISIMLHKFHYFLVKQHNQYYVFPEMR